MKSSPKARIGPVFRTDAFLLCCAAKIALPKDGTLPAAVLYRSAAEDLNVMLVERGLQVMNVEVVGDAYAIAANYLHKSGAIADGFATNDQLLEIVVQLFQRGEYNKLRLANKAIARFEAAELA
jgi:hypothetical protein